MNNIPGSLQATQNIKEPHRPAPKRMVAAVRKHAEFCVARLSTQFPSVRWDLTPETLIVLDKDVVDAWGARPPEDDPDLCRTLLAAYVGQVLIRHLPGARWALEAPPGAEEDERQLAVQVRSPAWHFVNFPFNWVCKRLAEGSVDSLADKFDVSLQLTQSANPVVKRRKVQRSHS